MKGLLIAIAGCLVCVNVFQLSLWLAVAIGCGIGFILSD